MAVIVTDRKLFDKVVKEQNLTVEETPLYAYGMEQGKDYATIVLVKNQPNKERTK
jgi:hypothetical protein